MSHIAVILSGRAYPPIGPALRFPALALAQCGASVRDVTYPDGPVGAGMAPAVHAAIEGATAVTFIAKSLGTALLAEISLGLDVPRAVSVVWVTPLFGQSAVRNAAKALGWRSLIISGSADTTYDAAATADVAASLGAESLVIEGANHSLEVGADATATVEGFRRVTDAVLRFARG